MFDTVLRMNNHSPAAGTQSTIVELEGAAQWEACQDVGSSQGWFGFVVDVCRNRCCPHLVDI